MVNDLEYEEDDKGEESEDGEEVEEYSNEEAHDSEGGSVMQQQVQVNVNSKPSTDQQSVVEEIEGVIVQKRSKWWLWVLGVIVVLGIIYFLFVK